MPVIRTLLHASSNDDRWFLCNGDDPADVFVFHEPNGPSGGKPSRIELAPFLWTGTGFPEHRALLGMSGGLVGMAHTGSGAHIQRPEPGAAGAEPTPAETATTI